MRSLTRLKSLQAFEAAARHGSFSSAASELNVTAAAVGQLVRELERWLGLPVFLRRRSGADRLIAMDDARVALIDIAKGLDLLERGLLTLKGRNGRNIVTITASQALVAKWLLPHLDDFSARNPLIDVRLDVTDRLVDIAHGEADIGIRCGPGHWVGLQATRLMGEEIVVVCSPSLLSSADSDSDELWLLRQTLIHDATAITTGVVPSWSDWLSEAKLSVHKPREWLRINAATAVIQAALSGQGLALVRRALVAQDLADGRLRQVFSNVVRPIEWAYFAVARPESLKRKEVAPFHSWLVDRWGTTSG